MGSTRSTRAGGIVLGLAILNLLALGYGLVSGMRSGQPRTLPEFNAEKIQLWAGPTPSRASSAPHPAHAVAAQCMGMMGIDPPRFDALRAALSEVGLARDACRFILPGSPAWWVFWPPVYGGAERERVSQALRAAGVREVLPIRGGILAQAYLLGVFQDEAQALAMRDGLRQKGLNAVEYGPRPEEGEVLLQCRVEDAEMRRRLLAAVPPGVTARPEASCAAPLETGESTPGLRREAS